MGYRDRLRKLQAVRRLAEGATTPGERIAALQAAARLERSLDRLPGVQAPLADGPVAGDHDDPLWTGLSFDERLLRQVLTAWATDAWSRHDVLDWAHDITHQVLLPDLPHDAPEARAVEAVLQLSAARRLRDSDRTAVQAFLDEPDVRLAWQRWFGHWSVRRVA